MKLATLLPGLLLLAAGGSGWAATPDERARDTEQRMTPDERVTLTHGLMAVPLPGISVPPEAIPGAGYVAGVQRLGIPSLRESDASLGVAYVDGLRHDGATGLPSGVAMGATWDPDLIRAGGAMIGGEANAKGFNVLLAGGANLMRDPRNGRTFEYIGEDPLLTGELAGAAVAGIQSAHVVSTLKHFAFNDQETGRHAVDAKIGDAAARESDLLAFEIAIERGQPGSIMCAYNQVNGSPACGNAWLLDKVLKQDWGYRGWVMSDWGAVGGLDFALKGLDQQSGAQLDKAIFLGTPLEEAAVVKTEYGNRLSDMDRRILRSIYAVGLDSDRAQVRPIDFVADGAVSRHVETDGIVLLRNRNNLLPLAASAKSIAVIGGHANAGVLSGGGSSQVQAEGGATVSVIYGDDSPLGTLQTEAYQRSVPLKAITARAPQAKIAYRDGRYLADAVQAARKADIAIVFATQWMTEGFDVPDLSLPGGQDALIAAIADANPRTIVVLETGGPVLMPWLDKVGAVVEAWYPGTSGADAIADILFGAANPSGRLPVTFPASVAQLPRPVLPGSDTIEPNFMGAVPAGTKLVADYTIEGADIGYRWFAKRGQKPLFAFGYGLSYTSFDRSTPKLTGGDDATASFTLRNTGKRAGADVAQLYLVSAAGVRTQRLVGFQKLSLAPGESRDVTLKIDPRLLAEWQKDGWHIARGRYGFALGTASDTLGPTVEIDLPDRRLAP